MQPPDNPANSSTEHTSPDRFPYRRLFLALAAFVVLFVALPAGYLRWRGMRKPLPQDPDEALRIATEEADRLDPGWRLDELEAKRAAIPDAENSALCAIAAYRRLPRGWPTWRSLDRLAGRKLDFRARSDYESAIRTLGQPVQLNGQQTAVLKTELAEAEASLTEARKLADLPHGRLPSDRLTHSHAEAIRKAAKLLGLDVLVRAQEGDLGGALTSCRAILNAGRGIGDEPETVPQLVRLACVSNATHRLERVLAQGMAPPSGLPQAQRLLEDEAEVPTLLILARGERASTDAYLQKIHDGTVPPKELELTDRMAASLLGGGAGHSDKGDKDGPAGDTEKWYAPERINRYRACYLRYATDLVELCKRPGPAPLAALERLGATLKEQPYYFELVGGGTKRVAKDCWRSQADARCAAVALAVERYRQDNGRWPASLRDLVPRYIGKIPNDPYDGRRLRYCRVTEGVGVYAVGPDLKDDGGDLRDAGPNSPPGNDVGFRLWDPKLRRCPPLPVQPLDELPDAEDDGR